MDSHHFFAYQSRRIALNSVESDREVNTMGLEINNRSRARHESVHSRNKSTISQAIFSLGGALLWLVSAGQAHALSGAVLTSDNVALFSAGSTVVSGVNDFNKFYCDMTFNANLPPCAQQSPQVLAYQVPPNSQVGLESNVTFIFTTSAVVTNWTNQSNQRVSLICQTTNGVQNCLKFTLNGINASPSGGACTNANPSTTTFVSITHDLSQCNTDSNNLQTAFGTSHIDWTTDSHNLPPNKLHFNQCSNGSVECVDALHPANPLASNISQSQWIGWGIGDTPCWLKLGTYVWYPYC